ncbi:hypothetical protein [Paenibacillus agricola]|uniref:hypothetical protein n=1 Tax=Paenibacillus agricola TaxID=2716264 RepID=UPI001FB85502|nr:hypothetical protein [Paenibacillus agricola]
MEWLRRHLLTRLDGFWLADRRDPVPLLKREWIHQITSEDWRRDIKKVDFLDGILFERNGETWLNVYGLWTEGDSERRESYSVSTALVSSSASQSLLNALTTCSNPHDFKLPEYEEEDMEFGAYPFVLKGWIWQKDIAKRLDEFDSQAAKIDFPPYKIGESIMKKMNLTVDLELREWFSSDTDEVSLACGIWSENMPEKDDEPNRHGNQLSASLSFLKKLCMTMECELVFEVQINRRFKRNNYSRSEERDEYRPPHNRILILSADGRLRDSEAHYQLR